MKREVSYLLITMSNASQIVEKLHGLVAEVLGPKSRKWFFRYKHVGASLYDVVNANFHCVMKAHSLLSVEQDSICGTAARVGCVSAYGSMKPFAITTAY